jgi:hypothetical protein
MQLRSEYAARCQNSAWWRNDASLKPAMSVISRVARFFGRMVREIETNHRFLVNTKLMKRAPSAGETQHCPNLSRHMYFDRVYED